MAEWTTQKLKTSLLVAGMVLAVSSSNEINLKQHQRIAKQYYSKQPEVLPSLVAFVKIQNSKKRVEMSSVFFGFSVTPYLVKHHYKLMY